MVGSVGITALVDAEASGNLIDEREVGRDTFPISTPEVCDLPEPLESMSVW